MQWTQVDTGKTTELGPETGVENRLLRAVQTGPRAGSRPLFLYIRGVSLLPSWKVGGKPSPR